MNTPLAASVPISAARPEPAAARAGPRAGPPWDRRGLARLYEEFAPLVHAVVLARAPAGEADDLVQETFVRAMRSIGSLRADAKGEFPVGPWLAAIARNLTTDRLRRRRRGEREVPGGSVGVSGLEVEEVLRAVRELPAAYAEPLVLRLVHSMPGPRIADLLGMTPGSVRVNLHRGLEMLREKMGARP